jgi:hypothetical protein
MPRLELQFDARRDTFEPGETVHGEVAWELEEEPSQVELRLFWYTEGRGDQDVGVVEVLPIAGPGIRDRRSFSFTLPSGPCSFSGTLISIVWAIELLADPGGVVERWHLVVGPGGEELRVSEVAAS